MNDFLMMFAQSALVFFEAAWLTLAVYDNIRHSQLNEKGFASVLKMALLEQQDVAAYRQVSGRRINNPGLEKILFRLLVVAQVIVSGLLWLATLGLLLAAFGFIDHHSASALAIIAALGFTAIWVSLLVGGEWFWYRIGMEQAQQVHFFLIIWGIVTLIFLVM